MVDKVRPLKIENTTDGSQDDAGEYTEVNPAEDFIASKGIAFENQDNRRINLDPTGDIEFIDISNPTGKTLKSIQQDITDKYPASNPNGYETPSQLNSRDTANRNRANHTGTQLASTISDFSSSVLATLLASLSTATNAAITSADSVLSAMGKLQAQITDRVIKNTAISGSTKTKITYDSKGLVTGGADAALDDLADVTITNPQLDEVIQYNGTQFVNKTFQNQVSAGAGITYFLTSSVSGISGYDFMSKVPDSSAEADESVAVSNGSALLDVYVSDVIIGATAIDAGIWEFNYYAYVSSALGSTLLRTEVYKRTSGGTETLLFTVDSDEINNTVVALLPTISTVQPVFACNATDVIVIKIYAVTTSLSSTTVHVIHSGNERYSHFHTPLVTRHNDLAGLQGGSANEFYHLTQAQQSGLVTGGDTSLHFHSADRNRSNHTGSQTASTISDFASTVLSTVLTGIGLVTSTPITSADTVLSAFGKLQAQVTLRALSSRLVSAGAGLSGGGDLSADRTISMPNVGTAGTVGAANSTPTIITDAQGRVSSVTLNTISILASQVSNFAAAVIATALTGLSVATSTDVVATDSILVGIGKLQAILNAVRTSVAPQSTGTANSAGTSTALAKADHVHNTIISNSEIVSSTNITTTSTAARALLTGFTSTPVAGTYLVIFSGTVTHSVNSGLVNVAINVGGTERADSLRGAQQPSNGTAAKQMTIATNAIVAVNGTQAIQMRWNITTAGTGTMIDCSMQIIRMS